MKKLLKRILCAALIFSAVSLAACKEPTPTDVLWEDALYTEDTTLGSGSKTITVKVTAGEASITFTIKTDKENLADAMGRADRILSYRPTTVHRCVIECPLVQRDK